jgi:hypothetical protein
LQRFVVLLCHFVHLVREDQCVEQCLQYHHYLHLNLTLSWVVETLNKSTILVVIPCLLPLLVDVIEFPILHH